MRIEKLDNGYKLTDLYITAAILCEPDMELVDTEIVNVVKRNEDLSQQVKKQTVFTIKGDPVKIKTIIDDFFNGKHYVDAHKFKNKVQTLKFKIFTNV